MVQQNNNGRLNPKALEVCGFLSYGILHKYTNSVNRIRLQAEFSAGGTPGEMRSSLHEIIREVDQTWNNGLLKTFFPSGALDTSLFLDTNSLNDLGDILTYSCRCFLVFFRWICEPGITFSGTLKDIIDLLLRPVMDFCGLVSPDLPKMPEYVLELSKDRTPGIRIEHRFSPSAELIDSIEKQSRLSPEKSFPWCLRNNGKKYFYTAFFLSDSSSGEFNDHKQSADSGGRLKQSETP